MRGLAFPEAAIFVREDSTDNGTPFSSSNADDIPIDPALSDIPLDPALFEQGNGVRPEQAAPPVVPIVKRPFHYHLQFSQAPQGDPFAPQPPYPYVPVEQPSMPTPKPPRKRRKVTIEPDCGFCRTQGRLDGAIRERLLSCAQCGRSGHPSCLRISDLGDVPYNYDWTCIECKSCEICRKKGDEARILFCDVCDRGWHMDCLRPPVNETPSGRWICPTCLSPHCGQDPQDPFFCTTSVDHPSPHPGFVARSTPQARESSVASSSRSVPRTVLNKQTRKGKARASTTDESEVDADGEFEVDVDGEETPVPVKSKRGARRTRPLKPSRKEPAEEVMPGPDLSRPLKSVRLRISSPAPPPPRPTPVLRLKLNARTAKGKEREEEPDESKKGMFDDLLSTEDRDITQTNVVNSDKMRFDKSRAEAERVMYPPKPPSTRLESPETPIAGPSSRPLRSAYIVNPPPLPTPGLSESPAPPTPDFTKINGAFTQRIRSIRFGEYDIQTWYDAPFPEEYANLPDGRLWICEFCLKYMKSQFVASRHQMKCKMRHPPGDEIYRDGIISIFEVDGRKNKIYCQNLCLLSKMFLDHKSLFYDVEPFLFYVMTEVDDTTGSRFVGYFSKEKRSPKDYNVSCIMTLPVRQRQGWGNLLIDFSYLLSKKEHRTGSPEKPLSALGALGYRNYWTLALMRYLRDAPDNPRLEDIAKATSMTIEDIYVTLQQQQMISVRDITPPSRPPPGKSIRFPKGKKNGIARKHLVRTVTQDTEQGLTKGPFVPPRLYDITWDPEVVEAYMTKWEAKGYFKIKPECLKWSPFLVARTMKSEGLPDDLEGAPLETPLDDSAVPDLFDDLNGGATPRAASSAKSRTNPKSKRTPKNGVVGSIPDSTASPALNLFDEPIGDVETLVQPDDPEALPMLRTEDEENEHGRVRRKTRSKAVEVEADEEEVVPRRSGRHSTVISTPTSTSPPQTSNHASPQKSAQKGRPRKSRAPSVPSVVNGNGNGKSEVALSELDDMESLIADDEALAKRLAMEDGMLRRQLRSRSNTSQEVKTLATQTRPPKRAAPPPPTPSVPSSRKRRRIVPDPSPDPPSSPPIVLPSSTRRPSALNSRKPSQTSTPTPATPVNGNSSHQRRSSRLTNGVTAIDTTPSSPELHRTRSGAVRRRVESPVEEQEDPGVMCETPAMDVAPQPQFLPPAGPINHTPSAPAEDVKYEDMDTPLTGVSRQSAPSDDTVYVPEDRRMKDTPVSPVTLEVPGVPASAPAVIEVVDDLDADAEGEDDVDAEGEPDDGDLDAEGEPDDGDLDAEGEVDDGLEGEAEVVMMI